MIVELEEVDEDVESDWSRVLDSVSDRVGGSSVLGFIQL